MINLDDLLSVLQFLNRHQLLSFLQVNRFTKEFVETNFVNKPMIYSELHLLKNSKSRLFCLKFGALNCDCEQKLYIEQQFVYKKRDCHRLVRAKCDILNSLYSEERTEQYGLYYFEYEGHHELCKEWELVRTFDQIDEIRKSDWDFFSERCFNTLTDKRSLNDYKPCKYKDNDCGCVWRHPVHDDEDEGITRQQIIGHCKFKHRTFVNYYDDEDDDDDDDNYNEKIGQPICGPQIITSNFQTVFNHLQCPFVQINNLDLTSSDWDWDTNSSSTLMNEQECRQYLNVLLWLVGNDKISPNARVSVEPAIFACIFERLNMSAAECGKLCDAIASRCAHLNLVECVKLPRHQLISGIGKWSKHLPSEKFLFSNALFINIKMDLREQEIKELLCTYNPKGDHHKLIVFHGGYQQETIIKFLSEDFMASKENNSAAHTYFALLFGNIKHNEFPLLCEQKNRQTGELLRIMPVNSFSTGADHAVSVYLARYSMDNATANREFDALAARIGARRSAMWENVMRKYGIPEEEEDGNDLEENERKRKRNNSRSLSVSSWMNAYTHGVADCFSVGPFLRNMFPTSATLFPAEHHNSNYAMNNSVFLPPISISDY